MAEDERKSTYQLCVSNVLSRGKQLVGGRGGQALDVIIPIQVGVDPDRGGGISDDHCDVSEL